MCVWVLYFTVWQNQKGKMISAVVMSVTGEV